MREIKFRAWHRNKKIMRRVCCISDWEIWTPDENIDTNEAVWKYGIDMVNDGTIVLMQWIGLKDRNGVDIFEGDIVKGHPVDLHKESTDEEIAVVEWEEDQDMDMYWWYMTGFSIDFSNLGPGYACACSKDIEVIGNIYENPELLKEK